MPTPTVLQRKDFSELPATMFLRPRRTEDHREFETILPWATPQLVYMMNGQDWIRWAMPKAKADEFGLSSGGCVCCGEDAVAISDDGCYQFDTALLETDWWLVANGYAAPTPISVPTIEGNPDD